MKIPHLVHRLNNIIAWAVVVYYGTQRERLLYTHARSSCLLMIAFPNRRPGMTESLLPSVRVLLCVFLTVCGTTRTDSDRRACKHSNVVCLRHLGYAGGTHNTHVHTHEYIIIQHTCMHTHIPSP